MRKAKLLKESIGKVIILHECKKKKKKARKEQKKVRLVTTFNRRKWSNVLRILRQRK